MVKVVMTGEKALASLTIDPEAVNKDDVEMLQDLCWRSERSQPQSR